jgi:hypothetical protein
MIVSDCDGSDVYAEHPAIVLCSGQHGVIVSHLDGGVWRRGATSMRSFA